MKKISKVSSGSVATAQPTLHTTKQSTKQSTKHTATQFRHPIPCAIYTRKSSEEGLEQNFNSLDAQREACEAYILSQRAEGWSALPTLYDDGGYTGGNMDRPGLKQLMADIATHKVRIVVVYKVDRLTRSLADFAKMVELFDDYGVSFVSVTQQFNTTSSMGRLTLNVLLSFAQFEREVTGERIRDKIAASKAKGMWMGGMPPIGYIVQEKALVIDESAAAMVREIYQRYLSLGNVRLLKAELTGLGWLTPARISQRNAQSGNRPFSRGHLYRILTNPVYIGKIAHRGQVYAGQHPAIIDQALWEAVQQQLTSHRQGMKSRSHAADPALLAGMLFGEEGEPLVSVHSKKHLAVRHKSTHKSTSSANPTTANTTNTPNTVITAETTTTTTDDPGQHHHFRRYRYYISNKLISGTKQQSPHALRVPATEIEMAVIARLMHFLNDGVELLKITDCCGLQDARAIHAILSLAADRAATLESACAARQLTQVIALLSQIIGRITIYRESIAMRLKLGSLIAEARSTVHCPAEVWQGYGWDNLMHTIVMPVQLKRSGMAVRLIIKAPEHRIQRIADPKLVKVLSKAHQWFGDMSMGKVTSLQEIADREQVDRQYVSRIIQLAFLAPDIVRMILGGKQPEPLTVDKLVRSVPLPVSWKAQRTLLGFD